MELVVSILEVIASVSLMILLISLLYAWFAGFIGLTLNMIGLKKHLVDDYSRWRSLPFVQAFFVGPIAVLFHPELVKKTGARHLRRARKYLFLLLTAICGTAIVALIRILFFGLE